MAITSNDAAGSNGAVTAQNNIENLVNSGSISGMSVTSRTLTTDGGSNDVDDSSGLSKTTIILLAVLIPVGVLRTNFVIQ